MGDTAEEELARPTQQGTLDSALWAQQQGNTLTNSEKAALAAAGLDPNPPVQAPPSQQTSNTNTGTDVDRGSTIYYDPATGEFRETDFNPDDPFANKDKFHWSVVDGEQTLTLKSPDVPSVSVPVGDNNFDLVYADPETGELPATPWDNQENPFQGRDPITGGIDRDQPSGSGGGYDPVDLGRTPAAGGELPTNEDLYGPTPGAPGDGGIIRQPWSPGGSDFSGQPGQGGTPLDPGAGAQVERIGWDDYANKDFYQDQFARLREGEMNQDAMRQAAAMRAQENAGAEGTWDPWSWVEGGIKPVEVFGQEEGFDPNEWVLNTGLGIEEGMTNAEILGRLRGTLNEKENAVLTEHMEVRPDWGSSQFLGSGYDNVIGRWAPNAEGSFRSAMDKLFNNTYIQAQDVQQPGGVSVPVGYAIPTP